MAIVREFFLGQTGSMRLGLGCVWGRDDQVVWLFLLTFEMVLATHVDSYMFGSLFPPETVLFKLAVSSV